MDTNSQVMKNISQCQYPDPSMLARKALKEFWDNNMDNSKITVICPKCGKPPKVTLTPKGERTTVLCECKYIISGEINFFRQYEKAELANFFTQYEKAELAQKGNARNDARGKNGRKTGI